ncbi:MAG: NADP-dependent malic enzyme [Candidatus Nealsonbacteria bacterium]|nr:NADP-dependent malic enzyme [Candidatus Nealsonbacteria bacterium]
MEDKNQERTRLLGEEAMKRHLLYGGKIQTSSKVPIAGLDDFSVYYTPGVAEPCRVIKAEKDRVYDLTNKCNTVAIVSDGTRVLGLGDIGPEAGLPVMEGKALLFKYLGGVDAVPICLDTKNPEEIIQAVKWLQPSFGGINLEDIENPKCFYILDTLRKEMEIPVWHDDQQGTATVVLAGLINALQIVGKRLETAAIVFVGTGAANIAVSRLFFSVGIKPQNCIAVDDKGILHLERNDIGEKQTEYPDKWRLCQTTNPEQRKGSVREALCGADVCIALSKSGPGVILPQWISEMNKDAIVFACANPNPEIWPEEAKISGARIVATGRSDFPNQVNNSLVFPALFRGALDVRAKTITNEMCIAAAESLANFAQKRGIDENNILPTMKEKQAFIEEAVAVGMKAQEQGVARIAHSAEYLERNAKAMINKSQRAVRRK